MICYKAEATYNVAYNKQSDKYNCIISCHCILKPKVKYTIFIARSSKSSQKTKVLRTYQWPNRCAELARSTVACA